MNRLFNAEVASGLLVVLLSAFAWVSLGSIEFGRLSDMGPGYMPRVLAVLMFVSGIGMTVVGMVRGGEPLPELQARPLALVCLAVIVFGLSVDKLGMVVAVVASTVLATLAAPITRHRETPILCVGLAVFAVLVFVKSLAMPISIWPR